MTGGLSLRSQLQLLLQTESSLQPDLCSHCFCSCIPLSADKTSTAQKLEKLSIFAVLPTSPFKPHNEGSVDLTAGQKG